MNTKTTFARKAAAVCAAMPVSASASAELLYEPGSYAAQENMVLHLDGIRNAGALKAHDDAAEAWADLTSLSGRKADINTITPAPATTLADGTSGWLGDGYYFNGMTFLQMSGTLTLGNSYTIQVVCDVDTDKFQTRYANSSGVVAEGSIQWPCLVGTTDYNAGDNCNIYYNCGNSEQRVNAKMANVNFGVYVTKSAWNNRYMTAWANGSQASLFDGGSVASTASKNLTVGTRTLTFGASYGSTTYGKWRRSLVGTIKAIRIYNKALSDAELAANRALDEARFFTGVPVTNVVVATEIAGLEGNEASGPYAFDAEGYTFAAPEHATLGGKIYDCTGYTLETWDGSAWGDPVEYEDTSCTLSDTSAKVRLTWKWEEAEFVPTDYTWMASPASAATPNASSPRWISGSAPMTSPGCRNCSTAPLPPRRKASRKW